MKTLNHTIVFSLFLFIAPFTCLGQEAQRIFVGINITSILANSYELIGEYRINQHIIIALRVGYAEKNGLRFKLYKNDEIMDKTQSGYFGKIGVKYLFDNRFSLLSEIIYSAYKNTGIDDTIIGPDKLIKSKG